MGKRACLWAYDLVLDLAEVEHRIASIKARSVKGTTGTQASFLALFDGDHAKVRKLETLVAQKLGFEESYAVTGQTYTRKSRLASARRARRRRSVGHKLATDLRILASRKELEEPFEADKSARSAMAYKRNPMRSERICALARFVIEPAIERGEYRRDAVDGTDAGRQRQPPAGAAAGLSGDRRDSDFAPERQHGVGRLSAGHREQSEELPFMATENLLMAAMQAWWRWQES